MFIIATRMESYSPYVEIFFLASVCVFMMIAIRVGASRGCAYFCGFVFALILHFLIWGLGGFQTFHMADLMVVANGRLWDHPTRHHYLMFLIYWILPWPILWLTFAVYGRR